ncbi:uncharacterized protein LOC106074721 isoform X1 [Biomphalaria glabrata]|uniref:Uncharacterized protein LOC106074721 isoform X1 n=1 Tax=Biomphalaria glabrata TaxID=6526 RepID=A0A9W3AU97_BIOGL|nr:uncharacterized protein LOC106074721 isoform X1 [Biomphalaria glabrata]XP_055890800.1 uncharacterized protein LOC106074721 isoform X1 [Biomphalaria glabrata]XP_055890801.1 uncharacterized protein LOC106074721 isoform X1 [Biomphalaria glabrata]
MMSKKVCYIGLLLLVVTVMWCEGEQNYGVSKEYNLCKPDNPEYQPPTVYMANPGDTTEIFVNMSYTNKTLSTSCQILLKTCQSCRFQLEMANEFFDYPLCSNYYSKNSPTECANNCIYLSVYDNYYLAVNKMVTASKDLINFMTDSSQLGIFGCFYKQLSDSGVIYMRLKVTVKEKVQVITIESSNPLPKRSFTSPNFSSPYVANSEIYTYIIKSSIITDCIAVMFDDWILSPRSQIQIQGANHEKLTGEMDRPYLISDGPSMNITFTTGDVVAGGYYSFTGFKAAAIAYKDRNNIIDTKTDCDKLVINSQGGALSLGDYADGSYRDCIWVIKKMPEFSGINLNILQYNRVGFLNSQNYIEIRNGLTSDKDNVPIAPSSSVKTYISTVGFYIRLQGYYTDDSALLFSYAMYTDDCSDLKNFFRCNSGRCIDFSLKCDGVNHCGDNSDESAFICNHISGTGSTSGGSGSSYSIGIGVIIPMVVSVFLVIVMCLLIIFIRRCRRLNNNTFGAQNGGLAHQQNRARRRRHHNHVQMSLTVSSGEHPPSYDEVIQNTPIGYLNMAFSWVQGEPGVAQPPSYEESVLPDSTSASSQPPSASATSNGVLSRGNMVMHSTNNINSPQYQVSAVSRNSLQASLDPGAYVSSSSSSSDTSEPDSHLNISSSSDSSTDVENGLFPTGIAVGQRARSNLDISKCGVKVSLDPKSRDSISKPDSERGCIELSSLALNKEKREPNRHLSRSMGNLLYIEKEDTFIDTRHNAKPQEAAIANNKKEDNQQSGREGMYVKKLNQKHSRHAAAPDSARPSRVSESSRSQSCVNLSLGGASTVDSQLPNSGEFQRKNEDKRFSYAGYGDVSLKRNDFGPLTMGRGLVRDRPVENLNKFTALSCDHLLDKCRENNYPGLNDHKIKATSGQDDPQQKESFNRPKSAQATSLGAVPEYVTQNLSQRKPNESNHSRSASDHSIINRPQQSSRSDLDRIQQIPMKPEGDHRHKDRYSEVTNQTPSQQGNKHYANLPVAQPRHKEHYTQGQEKLTNSPVDRRHTHSYPEPIYETPKQISDGQHSSEPARPVSYQGDIRSNPPAPIYQTPRQNFNQNRPQDKRHSEPVYDTPKPYPKEALANQATNTGRLSSDPKHQKPVPAPRQGISKTSSSKSAKPIPVARVHRQSEPSQPDQAFSSQTDNYATRLRHVSGELTVDQHRRRRQGSNPEDNQSTCKENTVLTLDPTIFNSSDNDVFI